MGYRSLIVVAACLGLGGVTGCGLFANEADTARPASHQTLRTGMTGDTLESNQFPIELRLPPGWEAAPNRSLHPTADLDAQHPEREMYLVILGESITAVRYLQLNENAALYRQLLADGFTRREAENPTGLNALGPYPAAQYELFGQIGDQSMTFLHTTLRGEDRYYQIVVWTPTERYPENKEAMANVVQGFRLR